MRGLAHLLYSIGIGPIADFPGTTLAPPWHLGQAAGGADTNSLNNVQTEISPRPITLVDVDDRHAPFLWHGERVHELLEQGASKGAYAPRMRGQRR